MTERIKTEADFNIVGDILETIRFRGTIFFHSDLAAPWGVAFEPMDIPRFHIALAGSCFAGVDQQEMVEFRDMEIILLPTGSSHWIADHPGRDLIQSRQVGEACELNTPLFQKGDITHRLMCGLVQFDRESGHPFLQALPEILHFSRDQIDHSAWSTALLIDAEIRRIQKNSNQIIDRLTEVLFLQLLDTYITSNDHKTGFVAALGDPRLKTALALIHAEPGRNWSVDELGKQVGMSRATLNRHFQGTIGITPMAYIQNWKMAKAYNLLRYSSSSIESIALQMGFSSAGSLSRAFQRHYGYTPGKLRTDNA